MKQPWYVSHAETIAQNVVGQIMALFVLWCFDVTGSQGLQIQIAMFFAAYTRGFAIRCAFERWGYKLIRKMK